MDTLTGAPAPGPAIAEQWGSIRQNWREAYAEPSFYRFRDAVCRLLPVPARAAHTPRARLERILFAVGGPGKMLPQQHPLRHHQGPTSRFHRGRGDRPAHPEGLVCHPFKGDMDAAASSNFSPHEAMTSLVMLTVTNNSGGRAGR
ncbi:MAG: hypothetical protein H6527_07190 [Actinobacteria bacterium]|nr:hypothetical protein [Actinomycetota bacterium]